MPVVLTGDAVVALDNHINDANAHDPEGVDVGLAHKVTASIGNGVATSIVVTHNLNTRFVQVNLVQNASPYEIKNTTVEATTLNSVTLKFAAAPATNEYTVVILG